MHGKFQRILNILLYNLIKNTEYFYFIRAIYWYTCQTVFRRQNVIFRKNKKDDNDNETDRNGLSEHRAQKKEMISVLLWQWVINNNSALNTRSLSANQRTASASSPSWRMHGAWCTLITRGNNRAQCAAQSYALQWDNWRRCGRERKAGKKLHRHLWP